MKNDSRNSQTTYLYLYFSIYMHTHTHTHKYIFLNIPFFFSIVFASILRFSVFSSSDLFFVVDLVCFDQEIDMHKIDTKPFWPLIIWLEKLYKNMQKIWKFRILLGCDEYFESYREPSPKYRLGFWWVLVNYVVDRYKNWRLYDLSSS